MPSVSVFSLALSVSPAGASAVTVSVRSLPPRRCAVTVNVAELPRSTMTWLGETLARNGCSPSRYDGGAAFAPVAQVVSALSPSVKSSLAPLLTTLRGRWVRFQVAPSSLSPWTYLVSAEAPGARMPRSWEPGRSSTARSNSGLCTVRSAVPGVAG